MADQPASGASNRARPIVSDRMLALFLAVVAAAAVYATWGGLDRPGLYHDEKAYLFQARTYAGLSWTEPTPPVPELWEQVHVFTTPTYASKYPPGFPAVLAPGAAIGLPGIIPISLAGATAALVFLLGTRLFGRWSAFAATALWISAPANTTWRAAYFSESLTGVLWLAWTWCAWRFREHGRRGDVVAAALLVAFGGITRPVTAIALSVPLIWIVWPRLRTAAGRRHALVAVAAGLIICAIVPVWNHAVLGEWSTVPYAEYSARTFPFDHPSLNTDYSAPPRDLPDDIAGLADEQRRQYEQRSVARMPVEFLQRVDQLGAAALPPVFSVLRFAAPVGLLVAGAPGVVALAFVFVLVLAHITMPHTPNWTIYYLDVFPIVAFGVVLAVTAMARAFAVRLPAAALHGHGAMAMLAGGGLLAAGSLVWAPPRVDRHGWMQREVLFRAGVCALPPGPKTVFVTRRPGSSPHHILVDNDPAWRASDVWVVRAWDPAQHRALMAAAPERAAYHYDERAGWFTAMDSMGVPSPPPGPVHVLRTNLSKGRGIACR